MARGERSPALRPYLAALACSLALVACSSPRDYGLLEGEPEPARQEALLRASVGELARAVMTDLSGITTDVGLETDDPAVRRNALVLNLRVGDEAARVQYHSDPVIGAIDLLTLLLQLQDWLSEGGDGAALFGEDQQRLLAVTDELTGDVTELFESTDAAILREQGLRDARTWAEQYPLRGRLMQRVSIAPLMATLAGRSGRSVLDVADSVEESVRAVETRLEVVGNRLPLELVLMAVIVIEDYLERLEIAPLLARANQTVGQLEDLQGLLRRERETGLAEIDRQRVETLDRLAAQQRSVEELLVGERVEALAQAEAMRLATIEELDRQRQAVLEHIDGLQAGTFTELGRQIETLAERHEAILTHALGRPLEEQRTETLTAAADLADELVADSLDGARELVDMVFLRVLALLLIAGLAVLLAAAMLRRRAG